jgi:hypothetical protein
MSGVRGDDPDQMRSPLFERRTLLRKEFVSVVDAADTPTTCPRMRSPMSADTPTFDRLVRTVRPEVASCQGDGVNLGPNPAPLHARTPAPVEAKTGLVRIGITRKRPTLPSCGGEGYRNMPLRSTGRDTSRGPYHSG